MASPHDALHGSLGERLHFTILSVDGDRASARLDVGPGLLQAAGIVHGGVLFTLADAVAANLAVALAPTSNGSTIDATIRYFRPVSTGQVFATATVLHRGRRTLGLEVALTDATERRIAHYTASFLIQDGTALR